MKCQCKKDENHSVLPIIIIFFLFLSTFPSCSDLLQSVSSKSRETLQPGDSIPVSDTSQASHSLVLLDADQDGEVDGGDVTGDGLADFPLIKVGNSYASDLNRDGYPDAYLYIEGGTPIFTSLENGAGLDVRLVFDPADPAVFRGFDNDLDGYAEAIRPSLDTIAPTAGAGSIILAMNERSALVSWDAGMVTDNLSRPEELSYQLVIESPDPYIDPPQASYNFVGNLTTITDAVSNGEKHLKFWGNPQFNVASATVLDLWPGTRYWFNILVRDAAGNTTVYSDNSPATDYTVYSGPGFLGLSQISLINTYINGFDLSWEQAIDSVGANPTADNELRYYMVYSQVQEPLNGIVITESLANGSMFLADGFPRTWPEIEAIGPLSTNPYPLRGLMPGTAYYLGLFVMDNDDNILTYIWISATTSAS